MLTEEKKYYKTVEQAREELKAIDPGLLEKYDISYFNEGVAIECPGISIICTKGSYGSKDGKYEIMPSKNGKSFFDLFGRQKVKGHLTLQDAIFFAECTKILPEKLLKKIVDGFW